MSKTKPAEKAEEKEVEVEAPEVPEFVDVTDAAPAEKIEYPDRRVAGASGSAVLAEVVAAERPVLTSLDEQRLAATHRKIARDSQKQQVENVAAALEGRAAERVS